MIACTRHQQPPPGRRTTNDHAAEPDCGRRTILTVRRRDCRWPCGDPADATFSLCGLPVVRGAYCAGHASRAYSGVAMTVDSLMRLADGVT